MNDRGLKQQVVRLAPGRGAAFSRPMGFNIDHRSGSGDGNAGRLARRGEGGTCARGLAFRGGGGAIAVYIRASVV